MKEERRSLKEIRDEMMRLREEKEMIRRRGRDVQEFRREVCFGIFYFCVCVCVFSSIYWTLEIFF